MSGIEAKELNYDRYSTEQYDRDIINSIPFHKELHERIESFVRSHLESSKEYDILDLGVGTGITAKLMRNLLPQARIDAVDFSEQMMTGARKKLGECNVRYLFGDYADMTFDRQYDVITSVIGIHHQDTAGKQKLFDKIHSLLKPGGIFIFGDLVTYAEENEAALNNAKHYHHLVEHAADEKTLTEWAHHHMYLNDLAPIEKQIEWLEKTGFKVQKDFLKINTVLLLCFKN
ncbi:MAG: class I SAM-dependent methyltransferase [Patescibacteria group bacterium]